jgi:hypothetical protein
MANDPPFSDESPQYYLVHLWYLMHQGDQLFPQQVALINVLHSDLQPTFHETS